MGGFQKCHTRICPQWQNGVYFDCHLFTLHPEKIKSGGFSRKESMWNQ